MKDNKLLTSQRILDFYEKCKKKFKTITVIVLIVLFIMPFVTKIRVDRDGEYTTKEDVALYIMTYHELPPNYITKYGIDYAKNHDIEIDDCIMGGDTHFNTAQFVQFGVSESTKLKECDIAGPNYDITGKRGAQRLVYTCNTDNVKVFYTYNHYSTFSELTSFDLNLTSNVFWIIFGVYTASLIAFYIVIYKAKKNLEPKDNQRD